MRYDRNLQDGDNRGRYGRTFSSCHGSRFDDDNDDDHRPSTGASSGARCFRGCTRGSWSSDRTPARTGRLHHPQHNVH